MDNTSIEKIKRALESWDIGLEQCMHEIYTDKQCTEWVVMTYSGIGGIQCEKCTGYFCGKHGTRTEDRDTWPIKLSCLCMNCVNQ